LNEYNPVRPIFNANKIVVVDGLVGGGKGLISSVLGSLPNVEMWVHDGKIEQVCAMHSLGHLTMECATSLIRTWCDEKAYNLSIMRDINCKYQDMSSVFKDARPWRYFARFFMSPGEAVARRVATSGMILNFMTHSNTAYAAPIFNALEDKLVYIRFSRCPMNEYMINHLARWSERWGSDSNSGMVLCQSPTDKGSSPIPFFAIDHVDEYRHCSPKDKAVLILREWLLGGNDMVDEYKNNSKSIVFDIPYEKFIFSPDIYLDQIASVLGTYVDRVTKKMMRKQRVPRKSLEDAPRNKVYSRLGWSSPKQHLSIHGELNNTRERIKNELSDSTMNILDEMTASYLTRYNI